MTAYWFTNTWLDYNGRPTRTSLIKRPPIHWLLTSEAKPTDYSIVSNSWRFHPKSVVLIAVALALRWPSGWQVAVEHNEGRALPAQFGPARRPGRWRVGPIIVVLYQLFPLTAIFFVEIIWRNSFPGALVVSAMHIKFMDSKHLIANRYARVLVPALELKAFITLL